MAVLHPGAMGAAVGAALVDGGAGGTEVVWVPESRGPETRARADAARLTAAADLRGCDVVLSVCPPAHAVEVARTAVGDLGFRGTYVDANAVSPGTAAAVAGVVTAAGSAYVDGGLIGPPPEQPGTTRLYLSGGPAHEVATLFLDSPLEPVVVDGSGPFAASATKMTYAAWTKVSAALLLSAHRSAEALDVADVLEAEWATSQPQLAERLAAARRSAEGKGWRWTAEMREIAATFAAADEPEGFGAAAAAVFARYDRPAAT